MSEFTRHTPSPWTLEPPTPQRPSEIGVSACAHQVDIYSAPLTNETLANARLIAAAPELLAALKGLIYGIAGQDLNRLTPACYHAARSAIKRAEGRKS